MQPQPIKITPTAPQAPNTFGLQHTPASMPNIQKRSNAPNTAPITAPIITNIAVVPTNTPTPIDSIRANHEECILKHFVCVEMFTGLSLLREFFPDSFKQERLVYLLAVSTRVKSASFLNTISAQLKYCW